MKDNYINVDLFCDYHVAKFIEFYNKEDQIFLNDKKNAISPIIKSFIKNKSKAYKYYYDFNMDKKTKVSVKVPTRYFFQHGAFLLKDDHIKINSIINSLFKQQLFSFVFAARTFSNAKIIECISKFLNMYNIVESDYEDFYNLIEALRRDLYRKGINN